MALSDEGPLGDPLLHPILRNGQRVQPMPTLAQARAHATASLATLPLTVRDLEESGVPVQISQGLHRLAAQTDSAIGKA